MNAPSSAGRLETIPAYDDLPEAFGARSGWGVFGDDDSVGRFNLLTPERARRAAGLVRTGRTIPLDLPLDHFPRFAHRYAPRHTLERRGPDIYKGAMIAFDDVLDGFNPQGSTQWDALAHASANGDSFYNGATVADIEAGRKLTIDHWARRGIVGRGVLVDVARYYREDGRDFDPGSAHAVTVADLEGAIELGGVELREGDILLFHFGFLEWHDALPQQEKEEAVTSPMTFIGLERSEDMVRWLWNSGAAALAADAPGVETFPPQFELPFGSLHRILIGLMGFPLGEMFDMRRLAADCAEDTRYEFLFTSAPLHVRGGVGSPPNALAVK